MIVLSPQQNGEMFALVLHESLWRGVCENALELAPEEVTKLRLDDADRLSVWAANCPNPTGQKAALVRAVVNLIRTGGALNVERQLRGAPRTFWERVA